MRALSGAGQLFLSAALVASSLCASPTPARADDAAKASTLAEAAAARVNKGERRVAIDLYEEAYAASPRREYLRAIAGLYDTLALAGDPRDLRLAILYCEKVLADEGPTPDRAAIEARLTQLRAWKARSPSEPVALPPARVPVHLLAYDPEERYSVTIGDEKCTTPCTLPLTPGPTQLKTTGAGEMKLEFVVPTRPGQIRLQHVNTGPFVAGAILVPTGIVTGASLWALGLACRGDCTILNLTVWPVLGASALITGIVLLATGRRTPPVDANRVDLVGRGGAPRLRFSAAGFAPSAGGAAGGLRFAF